MNANDKYYQILGINSNATQAEIKKAYRKLVLTHHPDKGGSTEKFQEIQSAYTTLNTNQKKSRNGRENSFTIPESLKNFFKENPDTKKYFDLWSEEGKRNFCENWEKTENSRERVERLKKEFSPKEDSPKEDSPKEDSPKEDSPKEDSPKEDSPKEDSPKEDSPKEDSPRKLNEIKENKNNFKQKFFLATGGISFALLLTFIYAKKHSKKRK
jgi:curved DNA-binding protein CbpA